nr:unnamed protein product [Digitaria exilis]
MATHMSSSFGRALSLTFTRRQQQLVTVPSKVAVDLISAEGQTPRQGKGCTICSVLSFPPLHKVQAASKLPPPKQTRDSSSALSPALPSLSSRLHHSPLRNLFLHCPAKSSKGAAKSARLLLPLSDLSTKYPTSIHPPSFFFFF